MLVQNHTKKVLVFGSTRIFPNDTGTLPPEFEGHHAIERMFRTNKLGRVGVTDTSVRSNTQDAVNGGILDALQPNAVEIPLSDFTPPGWDEWHGNRCVHWIKEQDDMVLLSRLAQLETRKRVKKNLEDRIVALGGRS